MVSKWRSVVLQSLNVEVMGVLCLVCYQVTI